jgi:hypothetical protein
LAGQSPEVCKRLNARLATVAVSEGCTSPVDFCAAGVITGDGLVQGRTEVVVLGLLPSVGFPSIEPDTTLAYAGDRIIETKHGDLSLRITGVFDTLRGEFSELERVVGGTGRFENAVGTVYVTGVSNAAGNEFEGDITGVICHSPDGGN